MLHKKNIFVLMGGKSPEHEISLISGREVVKNLDKSIYNIFPIVISKDGLRWQLTSKKALESMGDPIPLKGTGREIQLIVRKAYKSIQSIPGKSDVVFLALHGTFGEDGTIQGMLDLFGMKYTGSGVLASALGMDKLRFKKMMIGENIKTPKFIEVKRYDTVKEKKVEKLLGKPPYFVKPNNQGSSVGTSVVKKNGDIFPSIKLAFSYSDTVLIEEFLKGIEITCSVLGNKKTFALPVVEIIPSKSEYFDYRSKYSESGSEEIVPARISKSLTKKVQEIAVRVHAILGCRGMSRTDIIIKNDIPYVLEVNTIPGLTPMSLLPKAAKASGLSYSELLDKIIKYAKE